MGQPAEFETVNAARRRALMPAQDRWPLATRAEIGRATAPGSLVSGCLSWRCRMDGAVPAFTAD